MGRKEIIPLTIKGKSNMNIEARTAIIQPAENNRTIDLEIITVDPFRRPNVAAPESQSSCDT